MPCESWRWVSHSCFWESNKMPPLFSLLSDVQFEIDLPKKLVLIESDRDADFLLETLKKCGKEVKYNGTK